MKLDRSLSVQLSDSCGGQKFSLGSVDGESRARECFPSSGAALQCLGMDLAMLQGWCFPALAPAPMLTRSHPWVISARRPSVNPEVWGSLSPSSRLCGKKLDLGTCMGGSDSLLLGFRLSPAQLRRVSQLLSQGLIACLREACPASGLRETVPSRAGSIIGKPSGGLSHGHGRPLLLHILSVGRRG